MYSDNEDKLKKMTDVLYNLALLSEGLPVENTAEFADNACDLMV